MTSEYVNPNVLAAQYGLRNPISARAAELGELLQKYKREGTPNPFPFDRILNSTEGNPQVYGQKPFTYHRLVMALVDAPMLLENEAVLKTLPSDVVARARAMLSEMDWVTGAYSDDEGMFFVRRDVADFITARDRRSSGNPNLPPADPDRVILTDGSTSGVRMLLQMILAGNTDSAMIPIPQYPVYSAYLALYGAQQAPYHLKERQGWALVQQDLEEAYIASVSKGATPRCIVVINPGNPTGQVLERSVLVDIVKFAHSKKMMIIADQVYMDNVYVEDKNFHSFREVVLSMEDEKIRNETMLASMHTVSKGTIGECGRRGGYIEHTNFPLLLQKQLLKLIGMNICANLNGQIMVSLMCRPPQPGEASYENYNSERRAILDDLTSKAAMLTEELNKIEGIRCNRVEGAMYAFAKVAVPKKYLQRNDELNKKDNTDMDPDTRWCFELLEAQGAFVVPGSGFGQEEGTLHFRATILPKEEELMALAEAVKKFHTKLLADYS